MSWLERRSQFWRWAVLMLFVTAILGPWFFERLAIPAQYSCPGPNLRLSDNICGTPTSGIRVLSLMLMGGFAFIGRLLSGTLDWTDQGRELLSLVVFYFGIALIILPFFTLLSAILKREPGKRQMTPVLSLGLAVAASLVWIVLLSEDLGLYVYLWGSWLYASVAVIALIFELLFLANTGKKPAAG